jgi:hypothetical protein
MCYAPKFVPLYHISYTYVMLRHSSSLFVDFDTTRDGLSLNISRPSTLICFIIEGRYYLQQVLSVKHLVFFFSPQNDFHRHKLETSADILCSNSSWQLKVYF